MTRDPHPSSTEPAPAPEAALLRLARLLARQAAREAIAGPRAAGEEISHDPEDDAAG